MIYSQIYISLITATLTATVTLLAVYLTNRGNTSRLLLQLEHERKTRRSVLLREKLEELYSLSAKYTNLLAAHYLPYISVMKGEFEYNQALDMMIKKIGKEAPDFDHLQMLIEIYFPSLNNSFKQILEDRDKANDILSAHKAEYKDGNIDGLKFVQPMLSILKQIDQSSSHLKAIIITQEKNIG